MLEFLGVIIVLLISAMLAYSAGYQKGWKRGFYAGEDFQERFYGGGDENEQ